MPHQRARPEKETAACAAARLVEAAGRLCSASFEAGRTMPSSCRQDAGRVIRPEADPSARSAFPRSAPMSLYRAGLRLALFLPLGVSMPRTCFQALRQQGSPM
jgi:hypothetical protein